MDIVGCLLSPHFVVLCLFGIMLLCLLFVYFGDKEKK